MARFKWSRYTKEGRQAQYDHLKEALKSVPQMTDEELVTAINSITTPHLALKYSRDRLICIFASLLAKKIVNA